MHYITAFFFRDENPDVTWLREHAARPCGSQNAAEHGPTLQFSTMVLCLPHSMLQLLCVFIPGWDRILEQQRFRGSGSLHCPIG